MGDGSMDCNTSLQKVVLPDSVKEVRMMHVRAVQAKREHFRTVRVCRKQLCFFRVRR